MLLVSGLFKVESPSGKPIAGMALSAGEGANATSAVTDAHGLATLRLPASRGFEVIGMLPPHYQDLHIFGTAGASDFQYTTYMGTRIEAAALARLAGVPHDASRGYVVVGLDTLVDPHGGLAPSNLAPAVGTSAALGGLNESAAPFVLMGGLWPVSSQTISANSSSFVTFPNVAAAKTPEDAGTATASPPVGQRCSVSPGFAAQPQPIRAYPDAVSVVSFLCMGPAEPSTLEDSMRGSGER